jgi:AAA+ ATPase superfamily predicted ATPase
MLSMYASLLRNSEKETESIRVQEIDRELSKLGLPPSRRATNILQREFANICRVKPVNFTRLETKILDLGIREQ